MHGDAELGFEARNFRKGRIDQTFGLHDVEARGGAGFKLEARQVERFPAGCEVFAGKRDALLVITGIDVGRHQIGKQRQACDVDIGIGRIQRCLRAFPRAAILAEEIEQPRCRQACRGGGANAALRAQFAALAVHILRSAEPEAGQRAGARDGHIGGGGVDPLQRLENRKVLVQPLRDIAGQTLVAEGRPPVGHGNVAIALLATLGKFRGQGHFRRCVFRADHATRQREQNCKSGGSSKGFHLKILNT